jgi:hypothetical protein
MLLTDTQKGKLLYALPPPSVKHGSVEYSKFILESHRARYAELLKKKKNPNLVTTYEVPSMELGGGGEFDSVEGWMDDELDAELRGDGRSEGHTRLRARKNNIMERNQHKKDKKMKGKKKHGADPYGANGGVAHASGNKIVTNVPRPVLPHHPTYQAAINGAGGGGGN